MPGLLVVDHSMAAVLIVIVKAAVALAAVDQLAVVVEIEIISEIVVEAITM
jgi:hypothetical protein